MSDENDNMPPETPEQDNPMAAELAVLDALQAENADLKDRLLRALADTENTRRRAEREKNDASQYAVTRFARDILGIADNFQRAISALPADAREAASPQVKAVIEGVEATERQLLSTLERHGVKQIETADAKFDPNLHQAIAEVPGNGKPAGMIVDVVQGGYVIGDRLLRPAMVTVAKREAAPTNGAGLDTKA